MVGLTHRASQVCRSQSPSPRGRSLLTHASAGDRHSEAGLAQSLVCSLGPGVQKASFEPSQHLWQV